MSQYKSAGITFLVFKLALSRSAMSQLTVISTVFTSLTISLGTLCPLVSLGSLVLCVSPVLLEAHKGWIKATADSLWMLFTKILNVTMIVTETVAMSIIMTMAR